MNYLQKYDLQYSFEVARHGFQVVGEELAPNIEEFLKLRDKVVNKQEALKQENKIDPHLSFAVNCKNEILTHVFGRVDVKSSRHKNLEN